jgi:preprotein translocase SecE subunit
MATAVQTNPAQPQQPPTSGGGSLLPGSIVGALVVLAGVVAGGYASTHPTLGTLPYAEVFRLCAFLGVAGLGVFVAGRAAAVFPARGLSGGIILAVSALIATAFIVRAVAVNVEGATFAGPVVAVVLAVCLFLVFRLLTSATGAGWAVALEEQGWTSSHSYKRTQGLQVRRYTMIGILLFGLTGAWSVYSHQMTGSGDAAYAVPFTDLRLPILPAKELVVPLLLTLGTVWLAWRAVNVPPFADFLIATEAEMNKVSWTSRKKLIQDTIVVLVTVVLLTLFLLVIDLFWGWLLSTWPIEVLPSKSATPQQQVAPGGEMKLTW